MNKKDVKKGLVPYLFMILIMLGIFYVFNVMNQDVHNLTYNEFVEKLNGGEIKNLYITPRSNAQTYEVTGSLNGYKKNESFFSRLPMSEQVMKKIVEASEVQKFELESKNFSNSKPFSSNKSNISCIKSSFFL